MDSPILKMSEDRHNEIIKLMYSKVDIPEFVSTQTQLSTEEQTKLQLVLQQYPELFEGVIGQLKIPPVHFELKDGALPYPAKPFSNT